MSNVSYNQALGILHGWTGTTAEKLAKWQQTYNFIPPPPGPFMSDEALAHYIADNYTGPPIPT
jgi:hypothetical protein